MDRREKDRLRAAKYRRENPDKIREINRRSREKARHDPERVAKVREFQRGYRERNREVLSAKERERSFGLSLAEYSAMVAAQNNCCAICAKPETATRNGRVKALAVDHDHRTDAVRELLCSDCNTGIGKFGEDRERLLAAVRYLDKHSGAENIVRLVKEVG